MYPVDAVLAFASGEIYVTSGGKLIAFLAGRGMILWSVATPSSVVTLKPAGALIYVSFQDNQIVALRVGNGSVFWNIDTLYL